MSEASPDARRRIGQLDLFRYLCVTLAITSHIVIHHAIYDETEGGVGMMLKLVTRMATPSLVVLMGVMIEVVYSHRFEGRERAITVSLLHRALICGLTYLLLSLLNDGFAWLNTLTTPDGPAWKTEGYGAIFLTYALLLPVAPMWLWIRVKFGFLPIVLLCLAMVLVHALGLSDRSLVQGPLGLAASVFLGIGDARGPSVIHALGLMTIGMAIGNLLFVRDRDRFATVTVIGGAIISLTLLATFLNERGVAMTAHLITDITHWRHENHVGYYAYGILAAIVVLSLTYCLYPLVPAALLNRLRTIGSATLFYFFAGSVLLQAVPITNITSPAVATGAVIAYLTVFGAVTIVWAQSIRARSWIGKVNGWMRNAIDAGIAFRTKPQAG